MAYAYPGSTSKKVLPVFIEHVLPLLERARRPHTQY